MNNLSTYFPKLTQNQLDNYEKLYSIYFDWNQKINLVSRKDFQNFYTHHVLHSLSIAKFVTFKSGAKILDIGTGGGFPAIPLAIMFTDSEFVAVDSIQKKIKAVEDIIHQLNLTNISAKAMRAESLNGQFDFVVSRAVAPLSDLLSWMRHQIHPIAFHHIDNGLIALKGGDLRQEIRDSKRKVILKPISDYFDHEYFETKYITYVPFNQK